MAGLALLGGSLLSVRWLFHTAARHHQDPTVVEIVAGQAAILCFSVGGILATLGARIFDRVDLSPRWVSWPCAPGAADRRIPAHAFVVVPDDELAAALAKFSAGSGHAILAHRYPSNGVSTDVA